MFFLNLSAAEFLGLLGVLGGAITALYFLDRSKRKKIVSTLQFWMHSGTVAQQSSHKRVNQPWSLLLQLLSLGLLLLAIAQLQWGRRSAAGRDQVVLVDTSAWSSARSGNGIVLQEELRKTRQYLAHLRPQDRVLIARANALVTPATAFTSDRAQLATALNEITSSYSALDLPAALQYARQAQSWSGGQPGEIVYIGPRRVTRSSTSAITSPQNLRVIPVVAELEDAGITSMSVRRGDEDPRSWKARISLMNYGSSTRRGSLLVQFAGTRFAPSTYELKPHSKFEAAYSFVTNTAGRLVATLSGPDAMSSDDQASLQLSGNDSINMGIYTRRPELWKPLLQASHQLNVSLLDPSTYTATPAAQILVFDQFSPPAAPLIPSIWVDPPLQNSLWPVSRVVNKQIINWSTHPEVARGLHEHENHVGQLKIFEAQPDDIILASTKEGPTALLRSAVQGRSKTAVIGFDPLEAHLRFTMTVPLLFANLMQWMNSEAVRPMDFAAVRVGAGALSLESGETAANVSFLPLGGAPVPFTIHEQTLRYFVNQPTTVRIASPGRNQIVSLTLPEVADSTWSPPANIAIGLPNEIGFEQTSIDLWKTLAVLGGLGLLCEWLLFGSPRSWKRLPGKTTFSDLREKIAS